MLKIIGVKLWIFNASKFFEKNQFRIKFIAKTRMKFKDWLMQKRPFKSFITFRMKNCDNLLYKLFVFAQLEREIWETYSQMKNDEVKILHCHHCLHSLPCSTGVLWMNLFRLYYTHTHTLSIYFFFIDISQVSPQHVFNLCAFAACWSDNGRREINFHMKMFTQNTTQFNEIIKEFMIIIIHVQLYTTAVVRCRRRRC